ncbi:MAG TPA: 2'-5' RNA ligase family protein [Gaiellaceae bacterium]|nr:2'-5' RNA ligase family protein [Gaiellaceae bacterium]
MQTALVLAIDDAGPFDAVRRELIPSEVAAGIPFHVTLLYPFGELADEARAFFAERRPFELALTRVAAWPDVVYLVPEPDAELRALMRDLFARFPEWPPYGGVHDEVIPHATLAEEVEGPALRGGLERRLAPHLPHRCQAHDVSLLEEFAPNRWRERERLPLGG